MNAKPMLPLAGLTANVRGVFAKLNAPSPTAPEYYRPTHYFVLDQVRGAAILMVMMCHFFPSAWFSGREHHPLIQFVVRLFESGWIGVDLFFVLSGFLITSILISAKKSPHYFRNFYIRRALRIFPLYYLFLSVALIVRIVFASKLSQLDASLLQGIDRYQWTFWIYASNIATTLDPTAKFWIMNHLWSLAVEEHFYLVWPALIWFLPNRYIPITCAVVILQSWLMTAWLVSLGNYNGGYEFTLCRIGTMAFGALFAWYLHFGNLNKLNTMDFFLLSIGSLSGLATLASGRGGFSHVDPFVLTLGLPMLSLLFIGLIGGLVLIERNQLWAWPKTSGRIMSFFGKYSYSMYLFHVPIIPLLHFGFKRINMGSEGFSLLGKGLLEMGLGVLITTLIALLTWHCLEKPVLRWKRFFETGKAAVPSPL